jgi:hypothetical protein
MENIFEAKNSRLIKMTTTKPINISRREQLRHRYIIDALASELQLSIEEVAEQYESMHNMLSSSAKVKDYLPVLIAKRIRVQHKTSAKYLRSKDAILNGMAE